MFFLNFIFLVNYFLLYFTKVSIHDGLEIFFEKALQQYESTDLHKYLHFPPNTHQNVYTCNIEAKPET